MGEVEALVEALERALARCAECGTCGPALCPECIAARAAIAKAREEQREADARHLARFWYGVVDANAVNIHGPVAVVRHTPLTPTPLGDEVKALRARVAELEAEVAALNDPQRLINALRREELP